MTSAPRKFRVWNGQDMIPPEEATHIFYLQPDGTLYCEYEPWYGRIAEEQVPEALPYTGLDDAEGNEIYEGDVVHVDERYWDNSVIEPVEEYTGFFIRCYSRPENDPRPIPSRDPLNQRYIDKLSVTVIGNRFEDRELLEEVA